MADNTNNMNGSMCKSNCGFFGNAACDGYCSKCYKDHVKRQNSGSAAGRVTPTTGISSATQITPTSIAAAVTAAIANQSISQMNSISEIPVSPVNTPAASNSETASSEADSAGKMLPPLSPPPVTFSLESSDNSVPPLPQLSTSTSNSSAPIAIPGRLAAPALHSIAMSVPNDLCASMASTCGDDVASSIEMNNSLNANALSASNSSSDMASKTKKRTRCVMDDCKRKVGLTGFDCRCGGLYCWEHRYSDKHNCLFDYKELGQDQIRKANPIVVGEKIAKI